MFLLWIASHDSCKCTVTFILVHKPLPTRHWKFTDLPCLIVPAETRCLYAWTLGARKVLETSMQIRISCEAASVPCTVYLQKPFASYWVAFVEGSTWLLQTLNDVVHQQQASIQLTLDKFIHSEKIRKTNGCNASKQRSSACFKSNPTSCSIVNSPCYSLEV